MTKHSKAVVHLTKLLLFLLFPRDGWVYVNSTSDKVVCFSCLFILFFFFGREENGRVRGEHQGMCAGVGSWATAFYYSQSVLPLDHVTPPPLSPTYNRDCVCFWVVPKSGNICLSR